jgi:hypothetical protein
MEVFDEMVDDLRNGETIIAQYDSGLELLINYESLTLRDDDMELVITEHAPLEMLRAFLEIYITARENPLKINYDDLLSGNS